jgi:beta-mannosidase
MRNQALDLKWEIGYTGDLTNNPENYYSAVVPGAAQLDIATAKGYKKYYEGENWKDYLWMEDVFFHYVTRFECPNYREKDRVRFVSKGIDHQFKIMLNEAVIYESEGMYSLINLDLTNLLQDENELRVIVFPVPKSNHKSRDRFQANQTTKPPSSYGWDWHPRLIPSGIWNDTWVEIQPKAIIGNVFFDYELNNHLNDVAFTLTIDAVDAVDERLLIRILAPSGQTVFEKIVTIDKDNNTQLQGQIEKVKLWWPHDHGEQHLYRLEISFKENPASMYFKEIGFREVKLIMNPGSWDEPSAFPKSRSVAPATLQINGRSIFIKGTNWVQPDIFYGRINEKDYKSLLLKAKEANFNMIRVWGGGIVNKDVFYEYCNKLGIMVWQEFPLACNNYEGSHKYMALLEKESLSILQQLNGFPCVSLWCGGNELFNSWSGMDDQSLPLRLLNALTLRFDKNTPFLATSPLMGMGHGHYVFRDDKDGTEVFQLMRHAKNTAYTEFGMSAPSHKENILKIIPENELWPPMEGTSWESHSAFNAWQGDTWLRINMLRDYFGEIKDLDDLIEKGQLLQAEGYKFIYEEARRQKPYCSMALNWCFNEPWPTAANTSLLSWPDLPKPAFEEVKKACRPLLYSLSFKKYVWYEGELLEAELWMLNDTFDQTEYDNVEVYIQTNDREEKVLDWTVKEAEVNRNIEGPVIRHRLTNIFEDGFLRLLIKSAQHPERNSEYVLLCRKATDGDDSVHATLNL